MVPSIFSNDIKIACRFLPENAELKLNVKELETLDAITGGSFNLNVVCKKLQVCDAMFIVFEFLDWPRILEMQLLSSHFYSNLIPHQCKSLPG